MRCTMCGLEVDSEKALHRDFDANTGMHGKCYAPDLRW